MAQHKIGRNDPCPCGSGRKFKKCCYDKSTFSTQEKLKIVNPVLPAHDKIDYGKPSVNTLFFQKNKCHDMSAPRLVYSNLIYPGVEEIALSVSTQFVSRGHTEAERIRSTDNVHELIDILKNGPDSLNHVILLKKLSLYQQESIPLIIEALKKPQNDSFLELSVRVVHASGIDYSNEIIDIIKHHQRDGYAVSLLCVLLGFYDNNDSEKLLWDYYHYFREKWPHETFSDGPLLGLCEIDARHRERKSEMMLH